jgi:hypothetical protein
LNGLDPLHWRGDRTNFAHFNGAFDALMGGQVLSGADMTAYRTFINTIVFQPNPNQNLDRTLPISFAGANPRIGFTNYTRDSYQLNLTCNTCHTLPTGTARVIIPAAALQESQDFKVPQLRNLYQKLNFTRTPGAQSVGGFGIVHDGVDPDMVTFLSRPVFGRFATNDTIKRNINAFVQCLDTGIAPAVGFGRTLTAANVDSVSDSNDWTLLEAQAIAVTNIDLVVKGSVAGKVVGFVFRPTSRDYRPNSTNASILSRAELRAHVQAGSTLTIMGVPPGSGVRMGIDRNLDGVLDGDVPRPRLDISKAGREAVVSWHTNASGFLLEKAGQASASSWFPETSVRGLEGNRLTVTNEITTTNVFYRLREL